MGFASRSWAVPGTPCDPGDPVACDVCNSEQCLPNSGAGGQDQCGLAALPQPIFDPSAVRNACPEADSAPGCWTGCHEEAGGGGTQVPVCEPNDDFCTDISGGTETNECRAAVCVAVANGVNPSGCDYTLTPNDDTCVLCSSPAPASFDTCGNGVCEEEAGETFDSCSIDCRVPGFTGPKLESTDPVLNDACPGIIGVTFAGGPPFNVPNSGVCEDGDVCTSHRCGTSGTCITSPETCSATPDFCCPAGCSLPEAPGICSGAASDCDADCYIPQECSVPAATPSPTPVTPTPAPTPFAGCLQGGGGIGGSGSADCTGFTCSLHKEIARPSGAWLLLRGAQ